MFEKFRLDCKIGLQNTFYTKCINVIIDSIGPSIILRSIIWSFFPNFGQMPFPLIAGKSPVVSYEAIWSGSALFSMQPQNPLFNWSGECAILIHSAAQELSTVKPVLRGHSKRRPKIGFQDRLSLNAGQKHCRMLQWEHSAILLTFSKLPFVFKTFVLSIFEWPLKTGLLFSKYKFKFSLV